MTTCLINVIKLFLLLSNILLVSPTASQTCTTTPNLSCYQTNLNSDFIGTRNEFIKKILTYDTIKSEVSNNLLPTFQAEITSIISNLDSTWNTEINNYLNTEGLNKIKEVQNQYIPPLRSVNIIELSSGKCLTYEGVNLVLKFTTCNNNDNQRWKFLTLKNGPFVINSKIETTRFMGYDGSYIIASDFVGGPTQSWNLKYDSLGFKLIFKNNSKCLQINASTYVAELSNCTSTGKQFLKIKVAEVDI